MFRKWFLECLIHFSRNPFIPGKFLLLNVTFILATELQSYKRNSLDYICNYYQIWQFTFFWLYSLFPNSINENCELYFNTQWTLAHNDVTEPLYLLHYCLFMPLCFVFATLTYLLRAYLTRIPCLVYIFLVGKRIQYVGVLFPYIPVINHVHKINHVHFQLDFLPEKCNQGKGSILHKGFQVVPRFILKKSIADKFQNIKSCQYSCFILF